MINLPPDPEGAEQAEQRSEDDGMPVHPEKVANPVAWADSRVERERAAAAGYPSHPLAQASMNIIHTLFRLLDHARAPKNRTVVTVAAVGVGLILAAYLLDAGVRYRGRSHRERFSEGR
jgi:hypothetical protein